MKNGSRVPITKSLHNPKHLSMQFSRVKEFNDKGTSIQKGQNFLKMAFPKNTVIKYEFFSVKF